MSKKMVIHGLLLGGLVVYTVIAWYQLESSQRALEKLEAESVGQWANLDLIDRRAETATGMVRVAIPFLLLAIYSGILTVMYGLPVLVQKVSEGIMGSTAQVEPDPLQKAYELVDDEEYAEAVSFCYQLWLKDRGNRRPLV